MEWSDPAILVAVAPYGEGDALATVLAEAHGMFRGLARGGSSRGRAATWQTGNLVSVRWVARLADQLGSFTGELVHATAAGAMQDRLALAVLSAACATAVGALPEREPHPRVFRGLLRVLARLAAGPEVLTDLVHWELDVLSELGFGLDLTACAVSGRRDGLAFVSPRSGRAVTADDAGAWRDRLLVLPAFLAGGAAPGPADWSRGLSLTGHFLARNAFGSRHLPLPAARVRLGELVESLPGAADPPEKTA